MYLRCHALVWHSQLAPWVESTEWTPEELRQVVVDHITNVMGHYKGQCYAWDVVNEALNEDGTYRESVFYNVLGEDFLKLAFETASKVDPKAKLYYNDYNLEWPSAKTEGAQRIVKLLKDDGIRIDGVGLQAHLVAEDHPTLDQHIDAIKGFTKLGVEVALTELDIRLQTPATPENLELQKQAYKNVSLPVRSARDSVLTPSGCRRLRTGLRLHRCHYLGLLRPFQLGPLRFRGRGRRSVVVRGLLQAPRLRWRRRSPYQPDHWRRQGQGQGEARHHLERLGLRRENTVGVLFVSILIQRIITASAPVILAVPSA